MPCAIGVRRTARGAGQRAVFEFRRSDSLANVLIGSNEQQADDLLQSESDARKLFVLSLVFRGWHKSADGGFFLGYVVY